MQPKRAEIFATGMKNANGTVIYWNAAKNFGVVQLNNSLPIKLFVSALDLPSEERREVINGSQLMFDMAPGQKDSEKPKPRAANPRLIVRPEINYNK